jgi:hypothetical protein
MTALVAALLSYFPHGLPEDDGEACAQVYRAMQHLLTGPAQQTESAPAAIQPQAL